MRLPTYLKETIGPPGQHSNVSAAELKRCGSIFDRLLSHESLANKEYLKVAQNNYDSLFEYHQTNVNSDAKGSIGTWISNLGVDDKGQKTYHDLKENQSSQLAKVWGNRNIVASIMKLYSTCDAKGSLLESQLVPTRTKAPSKIVQ